MNIIKALCIYAQVRPERRATARRDVPGFAEAEDLIKASGVLSDSMTEQTSG